MNVTAITVPSLIVILAACSSDVQSIKYANEGHLLEQVSESDDGFFKEYKDSVDNPTEPALAKRYLSKGILLTDVVCTNQLNNFSNVENNTRFSQNELGVLVVLATGIMGINGASQDSFTKLALGGAAVNSSIDLYRNHYLLGPDSDVIITMVKTAMQSARKKIDIENPETFSEAFELLRDYSEICTDNKIREFVRQTIENTEFEVNEPTIDIVSENVLTQIALKLNRSGLSTDQYLGLYWYVKESPTNTQYVSFIKKSLGEDLWSSVTNLSTGILVEIKQLFLRAPYISSKYQTLINETKPQLDAAEEKASDIQSLAMQLNRDFGYSMEEAINLIKNRTSTQREGGLNVLTEEIYRSIMRKASLIEPIDSPGKGLVIRVK